MRLHLNCLETFSETYTPQFLRVHDQSYEGKMVVVDNHLYEDCRFQNCNFLYAGGPFGFDECEIDGGFLSTSGAARSAETLLLIFQELVRQTKGPY
jgi:hypothetical protein